MMPRPLDVVVKELCAAATELSQRLELLDDEAVETFTGKPLKQLTIGEKIKLAKLLVSAEYLFNED